MTLPKSQPAKLLKNDFYDVFNRENLCKASQNYKVRCNLEALYTALLKPTLNKQKDLETLTLFRNDLT